MRKKVYQMVKEKGWVIALAIIIPGGELFLLGAWVFKEIKDRGATYSKIQSQKISNKESLQSQLEYTGSSL